jgi:phosphoribosylformylglycinamidine synthase
VTARVLIRLKPGILDVQGASVQRALGGLGFPEVRGVRVGKVIDLDLDGVIEEATPERRNREPYELRRRRVSRHLERLRFPLRHR